MTLVDWAFEHPYCITFLGFAFCVAEVTNINIILLILNIFCLLIGYDGMSAFGFWFNGCAIGAATVAIAVEWRDRNDG